MADNSQKTEKATPRRLRKAHEDGDYPAAREFVSALQFFTFTALAAMWFPGWIGTVRSALQMGLRQAFRPSLTSTDLLQMFGRLAAAVLRPLAMLGFLLLGVTILFQMASTDFGFSFARGFPRALTDWLV